MNELVEQLSKLCDIKWQKLQEAYPKGYSVVLVNMDSGNLFPFWWIDRLNDYCCNDYSYRSPNNFYPLAKVLKFSLKDKTTWIPLYPFEYQLEEMTIVNQLVSDISEILNKKSEWRLLKEDFPTSEHKYILLDLGKFKYQKQGNTCNIYQWHEKEQGFFIPRLMIPLAVKNNMPHNQYWKPWKYIPSEN